VGGAMFDASLRSIAWEGRIVLVGFASGEVPQIPANILLVKNASALGFYWGSYRKHDPERLRAAFADLFDWHAEGRLRPHVSATLPLERAAEGLRMLAERRSTGKVVLAVG
jgi:NADPH:quinone reductase